MGKYEREIKEAVKNRQITLTLCEVDAKLRAVGMKADAEIAEKDARIAELESDFKQSWKDNYQHLVDKVKDLRAAWIPCTERLPEPSNENKLQSVKVINQDGDSVYYSYGYKRWEWYLSVNFEEECSQPLVTDWQYLPPPPESE